MFARLVREGIAASGGRLCVGLDPHPLLVPARFGEGAEAVSRFLRWVIEETAEHACAYKPNSAFFEALGPRGMDALVETVEAAHAAGRSVLLDAKRGDIASTAAAYAVWATDVVRADAITLVPYMGKDAVKPFLDRGLFAYLVSLPSNPSAPEIACAGEPPLCVRVAAMAARLAEAYPGQLGLVVGATQPTWAAAVHAAAPDLPWLVPGLGAQGGDMDAFRRSAGGHTEMIVNAARAVLSSDRPDIAASALKAQIGGVEVG